LGHCFDFDEWKVLVVKRSFTGAETTPRAYSGLTIFAMVKFL